MDYGKQKAYKGDNTTAYLTRLKPLYKGKPDRYIVTYYAKAFSGKKCGLKGFTDQKEEEEFIAEILK